MRSKSIQVSAPCHPNVRHPGQCPMSSQCLLSRSVSHVILMSVIQVSVPCHLSVPCHPNVSHPGQCSMSFLQVSVPCHPSVSVPCHPSVHQPGSALCHPGQCPCPILSKVKYSECYYPGWCHVSSQLSSVVPISTAGRPASVCNVQLDLLYLFFVVLFPPSSKSAILTLFLHILATVGY